MERHIGRHDNKEIERVPGIGARQDGGGIAVRKETATQAAAMHDSGNERRREI